MFKVNGTGTHFWIKTGKLTPLLTWASAAGTQLVLSGETMASDATGSQWFKKIEVSESSQVVFRADMKEGAMQVAHRGKHSVLDDGERAEVKEGGVGLKMFSSVASKLHHKTDQGRWAHINLQFESAIPADARGIFAEFAGVRPLSPATEALLKNPKMTTLRQKQVVCACPPPPPPPPAPPPAKCGLLTCKCTCKCNGLLKRDDGTYWYADETAQMDAFIEVVVELLIRNTRSEWSQSLLGVEQYQWFRKGNELTVIEQYENEDALFAHFGKVNSEVVPGNPGDNPWVGKSLYEAFCMSLLFVHWETGETISETDFPKAIMWVKGTDANALKNSPAGSFFAYESVASCPAVGSAAMVSGYSAPTGALTAGWSSPADVFDDDIERSYLDVTTFTAVGSHRLPRAMPAPAEGTCGLITCKCVCECSTLLAKEGGSLWYEDGTAQMDAFVEVVIKELIKLMRTDRAPGGDSFGVEQFQIWRSGNALTMVEQYESPGALFAHFGSVSAAVVPLGDNPWAGKTIYEAFAMSINFKNAAGELIPVDSAEPKITMYHADYTTATRVMIEFGSFFDYQHIDACPDVGTAATVADYVPPADATTAGWQTPADIIDDTPLRAFKDVTTFTPVTGGE